MEYELIFTNDYPLVKIDERLFLIDSGCQTSIALGNRPINVCGTQIYPFPNAISQLGQIESFGTLIDGIIGKDILRKYNTILISLDDKKVYFNSKLINQGNICKFVDDYVFEASIDEKKMKAYFDTGAHKIMFKNNIIHAKNKIGSKEETSFIGVIKCDEYEVDFSFNNKSNKIRALDISSYPYPDMIYFGISAIAKHYVGIEWEKSILVYE